MRTENCIPFKNRTALIITLFMSFWMGVSKSFAQSEQINEVIPSVSTYSQLNFFTEPIPTTINLHKENEKTNNQNGIVAGIVMFSSGAIIGITSHFAGKDYYDQYKKSAFTENTNRLRKRVQACDAMRIGGGVLAGAGCIVMIVSF